MAPDPAPAYREHAPAPALTARIACYWTLEAEGTGPARVLPDGCMDLLFDLRGIRAGDTPALVGAMTRPLVTAGTRERVELLGVRFRPGEAFGFLSGLPARQVRDALVPLREAWGTLATELGERLVALPDTRARLHCLDETLLQRRVRPADPRLRRAVVRLEATCGAERIGALAREVGLGERQLERLFDERVGVGPKLLARVARVRALLGRLERGADWAGLAAELGWSDQAHLTRDLQELAGVTPTELARALRMSDSFKPLVGPLPMLPA